MWILYVLAFIIGAALYVMYLGLALSVSVAAGAAVYAVGLPVAYVIGLGKVLASRPAGLPAARRTPKRPDGADPAVLQYFYGPALADADHAARVAYGNCVKLCKQGGELIEESF